MKEPMSNQELADHAVKPQLNIRKGIVSDLLDIRELPDNTHKEVNAIDIVLNLLTKYELE